MILPPVHVDYETRSTVNLNRAGVWSYARHPSTLILCVAWAIGDGHVQSWQQGQPLSHLVMFAELFKKGHKFHAFNATFERAITELVLPRVLCRSFTPPKLSQWVDTQAIARYCAFPGQLERCAAALRLEQRKDPVGHRLIQLFSKPRKDGKFNDWKSHPREFAQFVSYCRQDVRVDREVGGALPIQELPPHEQEIWEIDNTINKRGVPINVPMAKGAIDIRERGKELGNKILQEMTGGAVRTIGQRAKILDYLAGHGVVLPNLTKETVAKVLEDPELSTVARNILEHRIDVNVTSVAKYKAMLDSVDTDGRIRGTHAYCAATTHRWGGRVVQFQNVPRPDKKLTGKKGLDEIDHALIAAGDYESIYMIYGTLLPVLRDALRNAICAGPGRELIVADKASIEARVLGWLANDPQYLKAFREGLDLYKVTAAVIFGVKYDDVTDEQRWVGKSCVLGLGYGMGEDTFDDTCKKSGRKLPRALITRSVQTYRKLYNRIPEYWKTCEAACIAAVRTGKPQPISKGIVARMRGPHLTIRLPSGSDLWYPFAKVENKKTKWDTIKPQITFYTDFNKKWIRNHTYGGKIVENIVQSVSRDLLARALLRCEREGFNPVMHVHDEIINEPKAGAKTLDQLHTIFRAPPPWGKDLPLGSGGFVGRYYRKG